MEVDGQLRRYTVAAGNLLPLRKLGWPVTGVTIVLEKGPRIGQEIVPEKGPWTGQESNDLDDGGRAGTLMWPESG